MAERWTAAGAAAVAVAGLLLAAACSVVPPPAAPGEGAVVPPLEQVDSVYALAGSVALAQRKGEDVHGLHNVFHLSDRVISGSEPHGEEAFAELARLGVRTIVSVDGKKPDAALAARHGLRYVHIPIEYKGLTDEEILQLAKTFRECQAPFYAHCFHGKHRGPAAAAIGRLVLDGVAREQAIAEMRQWCGTAPEYEGLYRDVATKALPAPAATREYAWEFPVARSFGGFRDSMIDIARRHDALKALAKRDFAVDPAHPDVDPVNEATILAESFSVDTRLAEIYDRPADFHAWLAASVTESAALRDALRSGDATAARHHFDTLSKSCTDCHAAYRNH